MLAAKSNPFRVQRLHELPYRFDSGSWPELLDALEKLRYRAAIVGPHGHGKTTLLDGLEVQLQGRGWRVHRVQLGTSRRALGAAEITLLNTLGKGDCLFLDGAEQLSLLNWQRFLYQSRRVGALVITSHRSDLLPTLVECRTSSQLLRELMEELEPGNANTPTQAAALYEKHGGNLRLALRELYDQRASGY